MSVLTDLLKAATAAIPRPFESTFIKRIGEKIGGFSRKELGPEILEALEQRGTLPKGYGDYYLPPPELPGRFSKLASPLTEVPADMAQALMDQAPDPALMARLIGERRSKWAQKEPKLSELPSIPYRDELIPFLQDRWANPRIDVKSNKLKDWWISKHGRDASTEFDPLYKHQQMIFQNPDDYFELLLNPGKGFAGQRPMSSATHWDPMTPFLHVRGQQIGPRHLVQEIQSDWDRTNRLFGRPKKFDPDENIYSPETSGAAKHMVTMDDFYNYHAFNTYDEALNYYIDRYNEYRQNWKPNLDFPFLPPDLTKVWPETGTKMALAYAARNPNIHQVSFVDDLIASAMRGNIYNPSGMYSEKIPGFLSKYTKKHGGLFEQHPVSPEYFVDEQSIKNAAGMNWLRRKYAPISREWPYEDVESIVRANPKSYGIHPQNLEELFDKAPSGSRLSTVTMTPQFRKFLLGTQPLPLKESRLEDRIDRIYRESLGPEEPL